MVVTLAEKRWFVKIKLNYYKSLKINVITFKYFKWYIYDSFYVLITLFITFIIPVWISFGIIQRVMVLPYVWKVLMKLIIILYGRP
jgi:hypothetical protein